MSFDKQSTVLFYRLTFPNEVVIAACCGFKTHGFDPMLQIGDLTAYKNITAIFLSDYCLTSGGDVREEFVNVLKDHSIVLKTYYGTVDYVKKIGDAFLGNWKGFETPETSAYFAHQYGKCVADQYTFFQKNALCPKGTFERHSAMGRAYVEKETSQGEYTAGNAIVLNVTKLGVCALTTLGMSSGVHKTHQAVEQQYPSARFSILHVCRKDKNTTLSNNWSIRDLKNDEGVPEWVFKNICRCQSFASTGKQKGGSGGINFDSVLLDLLNRNMAE